MKLQKLRDIHSAHSRHHFAMMNEMEKDAMFHKDPLLVALLKHSTKMTARHRRAAESCQMQINQLSKED
jgi:hypothetical protein